MPTELSAETIRSELSHPIAVDLLESVDSTNTEAKRRIASGLSEPLLLLAEAQTAGRGRLGRTFCSPAGAGLYMSIVLHPNCPVNEVLALTSAAAVAVCEAIDMLTPLRPMIKWVNDIYLSDKKVCGILAEGVTDPAGGLLRSVVVGIGINCTPAAFPDEVAAIATSLEGEGAKLCRNRLAAVICDRLLSLYGELSQKKWLALYRSRSWLDGKAVVWRQNNLLYEGIVQGIADDCSLRIATPNGEVALSTGEVSVRPIERAFELAK